MKIIIDTNEVKERRGTNEKGPWVIRTQTGYVDTGKRYPAEIKIRLGNEQPPFEPGEFTVDLSQSVYVSKYGSLALSEELKLVPLAAAKAARA